MSLYISKVKLENIRCFKKAQFEFGEVGTSPSWAMFVGDNATGKTTLLRAIAMGLCDESSAAGLLRESDTGILHLGADEGHITIQLNHQGGNSNSVWIETSIRKTKTRKGFFETLSQTTNSNSQFPWDEIFVCAYGAGRGTSGTGDVSGYSALNATYNLFNYSEGLQNPELTLRRIKDKKIRGEALEAIRSILGESVRKISLTESGIEVSGSWGPGMPLRDLADGFKSSFLWITDFIGWALERNPDVKIIEDLSGIILIDEIEQHLHPKWRIKIVDMLQRAFPNIQFLITTHSELVARSVGADIERKGDRLFKLNMNQSGEVVINNIPEISKLDPTQALESYAFEMNDVETVAVRKYIKEFKELRSSSRLTPSKKIRLAVLAHYLSDFNFVSESSEFGRTLENEILVKLRAKIRATNRAKFRNLTRAEMRAKAKDKPIDELKARMLESKPTRFSVAKQVEKRVSPRKQNKTSSIKRNPSKNLDSDG